MINNLSDITLKNLIPPCCRIGFANIDEYDEYEKNLLFEYLPGLKTIIVTAHHITNSLEWIWYPLLDERHGSTCGADLHSQKILGILTKHIEENGYRTAILPYPGICGIMFKTLATRTNLGELGDNFLFMNGDWGPWIHLRVLLTDASVAFKRPDPTHACTHCGKCLNVCPGDAIVPGLFDGHKCRESIISRKKRLVDVPYVFQCEICVRACPVGNAPAEVKVI